MKKFLPAGIILLALVVHSLVFVSYTIDDAYITFTSAKNLAEGYGPVFVPGEHVEATSSFLWACLLAPFELVGIGSMIGSKVLGLLFAVLTVFTALRLLRSLRPSISTPEMTVTGMLLAACSPFILWSMYGMEHGMVAFLLVLAVLLFEEESWRGWGWLSAIPIVLLQMARPEGFIFVILFIVMRVFRMAAGNADRQSYLLRWLLALALPLVIYEAWGMQFYGYLLPNTVAAKVDGSMFSHLKRGILYLTGGRSAVMTYLFLFSLLAAVPVLFARARMDAPVLHRLFLRRFGYLLVLAVVGVQMLFTIFVGGDWMPNGRFLSHVAPLIIIGVVCGVSEILEQMSRVRDAFPGLAPAARGVMTVLAAGFIAWNAYTSERSVNGPVGELQASEEKVLGGTVRYLNRIAHRGDAVACSDIGRMGYYFKGSVIDWWGLADEEIARSGQALGRIRPQTILQRNPRFIVLYSTQPVLSDSSTDYGMATYSRSFMESGEFRRNYRQVFASQFGLRRYHVLFEHVSGAPGRITESSNPAERGD